MAQRKLQQEIDKTFKKVAEGIQAFEGIYDKIAQTTNASQKEKLEDALKREIKKLQRQRDQIKTWAASNEIKDKKPLLEQRKLIETQMEKFKAVEKEMKTKAYSKEGLSAAAKLDPKEKEKLEACQFLSNMVEELERQIETLEAEAESLQATMKKGKKDTSKADRVQEVERLTERHKWHQGKLEQILRALENGSLETEQVIDLEESIKYYVENNQDVDFAEDEEIYDELNLDEEDDAANNDGDRVSSQDAQSVQDEPPEMDSRPSAALGKSKATPATDSAATAARRPSTQQTKSPLPALATLHTPLSNVSNGTAKSDMKPAPLPARAPGETLKYASAAAAAAASDKNSLGIAPLPPPPGAPPASTGISPLPPASATKALSGTSPSAASSQPTSSGATPSQKPTVPVISADSHAKSPALSQASTTGGVARVSSTEPSAPKEPPSDMSRSSIEQESQGIQANGASGPEPSPTDGVVIEADESIFHLPAGLQELIQSFETTKTNIPNPSAPATQRLLAASQLNVPESFDAEKPRHYRPKTRYNTPPHYPQESLPIFDDPRLYSRIDTDTLFYVFYYQQGTYQQFLAAKALKNQSWRFHKQYQTWFQRHEEPKIITEEFEQGTYRFFDYESTWMNRRKADFKFVYKFLEDDL